MRSSWIIVAGVAIALIAGVAAFWAVSGMIESPPVAESEGRPLIGGDFELVNHAGDTVTNQTFEGSNRLIYFGYTYCPDVCPLSLSAMTAAYDELPEDVQNEVVPLFITVDPERDTVEAIADYVSLFHPDLVGLTGSTEQVDDAADTYRVYYQLNKPDEYGDYLVDHSSFTYLMDGEGNYLTHFGHGTQADEMAQGITAAVRGS
ncbi:MAG: SCO family protein [Pseudomonadota bacterium]